MPGCQNVCDKDLEKYGFLSYCTTSYSGFRDVYMERLECST